MKEREVSDLLTHYFAGRGLSAIGKFNVFDHVDDDADERSFIIDLAFEPMATKGNRSNEQVLSDTERFEEAAAQILDAVRSMEDVCIFPTREDQSRGWQMEANRNPMVGLAVEIENAPSKYFLGSLMACAITGRWGLLVVPDSAETEHWVNTVRRMIHKGSTSPIPSNIMICSWPNLRAHIRELQPEVDDPKNHPNLPARRRTGGDSRR